MTTEHARVVVIGGGNMGAGVLYHLAREGWTDCVLLEKAELTSGATWHAAGLVSRMIAGFALGSMHDYAVDLYKSLEEETGQAVSWHGCGSLRVATTKDHLDWLNHTREAILARGQEAHLVSTSEFQQLNPLYDAEAAGVIAALYTIDDGHVDPSGVCHAMAKGARQMGARIKRHCRVTGVMQLPGGEWCVTTEQGEIICEHVVNAGGYHARQLGAMSGLDLPITTMQHHYVVTDDVPEFADMQHEIPVTRDDYFCGYLRREQNSVLIGLYDKQDPRAVWLDGCPWESESELFEANLDGITPWLENCFERCPVLMDRGIKQIVNGGITYTPDGAMLLGPAPGLRNYWLACGATVGIAWGPGAGRALAQWMIHGSAEVSTRGFDPRRFGAWADKDYSRRRATEDYTLRQAMPYPQIQRQSCRNIRLSAVHKFTATAGALYEDVAAWERPRLYTRSEPLGWRRTSTFERVKKEVLAVRNGVGLGDFSAFAQFEISGPGAATLLDRVCANRLPVVGRCCLTALLNHRGTYEGEATIARLDEERFWFTTGAPSELRIWDWLGLHNTGSEDVAITNYSSDWGILLLAGPGSRDLLAQLSDQDMSSRAFPWMAVREITLGNAEALALRLSFSGDLAWEIHAPGIQLVSLWEKIVAKGESLRLALFGSAALNSMRLEKAYRGGHELSNDITPLEAGMMKLVDMSKEFIGKHALLQCIERGPSSECVCLEIEQPDHEVLGGEAVFKDGVRVGSVTSGGYGASVGKGLAMAYLSSEHIKVADKYTIEVLGEEYIARILAKPAFDPDNSYLRS